MRPEITDAVMDRVIETKRMIQLGRDYWLQGRVGLFEAGVDDEVIQAGVKGSARRPYIVTLSFGGRAGVATSCTCPIAVACKHAAAVLFALRAAQKPLPPTGFLPVADTGRQSTTGRVPEALPAVLTQWATGMLPLYLHDRLQTAAAATAVIFVVRVQAQGATTRLSKKRPLASMTLPGGALRLFIEAVSVALDEHGVPKGSGTKVRAEPGYSVQVSDRHVSEEDRLLVRRLGMRGGDTDHENCLTGVGGADLFERIVATGRARWGDPRGPVLHAQAKRAARLAWRNDELGRARLVVDDVEPSQAIVLAAPPFLIDGGSGAVVTLDLDMPFPMAEQLLRLPPIEPGSVALLAARWHELVPQRVPAPVAPDVRELGMIDPVPVVTLLVDQVTMAPWYDDRYRYGNRTRQPCALARMSFDYAGTIVDANTREKTLLVRDGDDLVRFTRDLGAELEAMGKLEWSGLLALEGYADVDPNPRQAWDHTPDMPAVPEDFAAFMINDADELRAEGWRIGLAADFPLRVAAIDSETLSATVEPSGTDWFDIGLGATVDGQRIDLVPALRRMLATVDARGFDALAADLLASDELLPVSLGDGKVAAVKAEIIMPVMRALMMLAANGTSATGNRAPGFSRFDLGLLQEMEAAIPGLPWSGADSLRKLAGELTRLHLQPAPLPPGFDATLRPYQQTGFDWLEALARAGFGGLLADDMGLGKTVQTLAHIASQKAAGELDGPVLIVAPTSVLPNWQAEVARFTPGLRVFVLHGRGRNDREGTLSEYDIVLTTYPVLIRDVQVLSDETFGLVVLDEAHVLKNPRTAAHAAVRGLSAARRIALTGTPVENRLTDAWSLIELAVPGLLGKQRDFQRMYRTPIEKHDDRQARARLARKLRPFMLRRTKEAVATDLPAKTVVPVHVVPGTAQMAMHESQRVLMHQRVRDEIARVGLMRAQIMLLTALTRLRQVCCDPRLVPIEGKAPASAKLERLLDLVDELVAEGRRIIIFSQFTGMLDLIKPELDRGGHGWVELTGKSRDRTTPVSRFQAGEVPIILISLKAGGTGLNLTSADSVILYDPWWNPAVEAQAIDRAHRIGQQKPVFVYRLIAKGTIEEKILALQERKADLADALWSDNAATPAHLTEEDIDFLLG